jgi:protein required for attachment to host cells
MKTWILVANRTEAKIFKYLNKRGGHVEYLTSLKNPRGRLRAIAINADRPGTFANLETYGARLVKSQSPTERVAQEFAKRVCVFLEHQVQDNQFDELVVISDPHFLGRLRHLFSKELKKKISREIKKDLIMITSRDLEKRLWPQDALGAGGGT